MENLKDLKIALVHDFLIYPGGAEKVLEVMAEMFPEAPIYTLIYDKELMKGCFQNRKIHASFLQKFPKFLRKRKKWLLPFLPTAPETFDLREFDLIISSSGAWSKGIVTRLNTIHVAYLHSPIRFAWSEHEEYLSQQKAWVPFKFISRLIMNYIRIWDKMATDRPDYLIANSKYTQARLKKYYNRDSEVIYPSVNIPKIEISHKKRKEYFLIISRLSPYKKINMAVEAFNKLGWPLIIIGEGPEKKYLKKIAKKNVKILGWVSEKEKEKYYAGARAFIFPGVDDFGLAPVEAMVHGIPVLALKKGGALEIIIEGQTGEFFEAATPEIIADSVRRFVQEEQKYNPKVIRAKAEEFSRETFKNKLRLFLEKI
ncbi:MAG: glycosyltransferase family 4 protein [Candidatus Moranbacteria bacterium CG10_big_fil_rev_8_21_14_0_10_35_21]|nr:MAG: glycosyltransferase family 4 protein [Candidatus Moranbacteria bacterium CG10_big_fil_rev_8_21_14_0_10_35_21]PJA88313.1 MAG: glycosyltransferase family 4 protein [Candidatus Moranbacteria bacterium CG_4_9_14_3_um_filter_36_9]